MTRDLRLARRARRHGAHYALRIIRLARRAGLPISLGFAIVEQESGFRNVYGHDAVRNPAPKGGRVTRANYRDVYLPARGRGLGMQGVGPCQLTWYELQDAADRAGGCWRPTPNIATAFDHLAALVAAHGLHAGLAAYNGAGPAAERYAAQVRARMGTWHRILTGVRA
jgi:hypothetical protein